MPHLPARPEPQTRATGLSHGRSQRTDVAQHRKLALLPGEMEMSAPEARHSQVPGQFLTGQPVTSFRAHHTPRWARVPGGCRDRHSRACLQGVFPWSYVKTFLKPPHLLPPTQEACGSPKQTRISWEGQSRHRLPGPGPLPPGGLPQAGAHPPASFRCHSHPLPPHQLVKARAKFQSSTW